MAKIIKKGYQLEQEYYEIKKEQADKSARDIRKFGKATAALLTIYAVSIIVSIIANMFLKLITVLTVCFVLALIVVASVYLSENISKYAGTDILISGIQGERIATQVLATLPDGYTVFQNVTVTYDNKESEIDNIVVGKSGVFIIEVKNHNGHIVGDIDDISWIQHKVGRGGTPYANNMSNPVKQIGTHIYRLANYLRQNGVNTYIEGMVYFANKSCLLSLSGNSAISVYASSDCGEEQLCRRILSGNHNLNYRNINYICKLIDQL